MEHARGQLARVAAAALAAVALSPLAGCSVQGEVFVEGREVRLDLMVQHERDGEFRPCLDEGAPRGLTVNRLGDETGQVTCRISGRVAPGEDLGYAATFVALSDGYAYLRVPPQTTMDGVGQPLASSVDVTVHFPGEVVAASRGGQVFGSTVRWTDAGIVSSAGMNATGRLDPTLPGWVLPLVAGAAWGTALVGLGYAFLSRRRRPDPTPAPGSTEQPTAGPEPSGAPTAAPGETVTQPSPPPEDPTVWAGDG